jgi:tetratricopeptide (TPR) repeat protein
MAECYLGLGEHGNNVARRREDLMRSVAIREDLVATTAGDTRLREELARSYQALGDSDLAAREHRNALSAFLKARDIEATLIRDHPDSPAYQHDFAWNLGQIALCLCQLGRHQDETVVRPLAIEHARTAFEQSPQVVAYGRLYGRLVGKDGDNLFSQFRPDDGVRAFRQAVSVQLRLIRENPAVPDLPGDLVETCASAFSVMVYRNRASDAAALLREAIDALAALPRDEPNVLFGLSQLLAIFSTCPEFSGEADAMLDRRVQNEERAVAVLRRAIAAGFRDVKAVESSDPLKKLRGRDDLKGLLTEMAQSLVVAPLTGGAIEAPRAENPADPGFKPSRMAAARIRRYQEELATSQHAIGLIQFGLKDLDEARKSLSQALSLRESLAKDDPGLVAIRRQLAEVYLDKGENDRALDLADMAIAARPDDPLSLASRGYVKSRIGQLSQAEADLSKVVQLRPDDWHAWNELGKLQAKRGLPDAAVSAFVKVMELTPESKGEEVWWTPDRAGIGVTLGPFDEIFRRIIRARPTDRTLLLARFHYLGRRRRWKEAAEMAARIIELDPVDKDARWYHRLLLLFCGDVEGYRRAAREAVANGHQVNADQVGWDPLLSASEHTRVGAFSPRPPGGDFGLHRGILAYREGQYAVAIRELTEFQGSTTHPLRLTLIHTVLAMAHQRLGQVAEARRELDAARKRLDRLGRVFWNVVQDSAERELLDYGWTEWVIATIVSSEAEALIVYDPIFPADPFAR